MIAHCMSLLFLSSLAGTMGGSECSSTYEISRNGTCSKSVVVVFTGEVRGDTYMWTNIRDAIINPNNADVVIDVWSTTPGRELELRRFFNPCIFRTHNRSEIWKRCIVREDPRFKLVGENIHTIGPGESGTVVSMFYNMFRSAELWKRFSFKAVIRARLDVTYRMRIPLPKVLDPYSVYGDFSWAGRRDDIPNMDSRQACDRMMSDTFAFGDFWGMATFHDVFPTLPLLLEYMKQEQGFRNWWSVGNHRAPGTFLSNAEAFLAWRLRLSYVHCHHFNAPQCLRCKIASPNETYAWEPSDSATLRLSSRRL